MSPTAVFVVLSHAVMMDRDEQDQPRDNMEWLLEHCRRYPGVTIFRTALINQCWNCAKELISAGVDVDGGSGQVYIGRLEPVITRVFHREPTLTWLANGFGCNADGWRIKAATFLLENGADPNIRAVGYDTPMQVAMESRFDSMVQLLVRYGASKEIALERGSWSGFMIPYLGIVCDM